MTARFKFTDPTTFIRACLQGCDKTPQRLEKLEKELPKPVSLKMQRRFWGSPWCLDKEVRAWIVKHAAGLSIAEKWERYLSSARLLFNDALNDAEKHLSDETLKVLANNNVRWWHGGVGGLAQSGLILPPDRTGVTQRPLTKHPDSRKFVWVAQHRNLASVYGRFNEHEAASVYHVQPSDDLHVDPVHLRMMWLWHDDPEVEISPGVNALTVQEFRCTSAKVLAEIPRQGPSLGWGPFAAPQEAVEAAE